MKKLLLEGFCNDIIYDTEDNSVNSLKALKSFYGRIFLIPEDMQVVTENEVVDVTKGDAVLILRHEDDDSKKKILVLQDEAFKNDFRNLDEKFV